MTRTLVVYVHGLWLWGGESVLLRRRLTRMLDAECRYFSYSSARVGADENARALGDYLGALEADVLHLVAHSMGGAVILRCFELGLAARLPPGRVVFVGSPVQGSRSAARFVRWPGGRRLLGATGADLLLGGGLRRWPAGRELGVIAGDRAVGLGRLLGRIDAPSDGTVWVDETVLPGAAEHIRLHVTHAGMVFSAAVAAEVASFLRDGHFSRPRRAP